MENSASSNSKAAPKRMGTLEQMKEIDSAEHQMSGLKLNEEICLQSPSTEKESKKKYMQTDPKKTEVFMMGEGSGNHKDEQKSKEQKSHFKKIEEEEKVIQEDDGDGSSSGVAFSESVYSMASRQSKM